MCALTVHVAIGEEFTVVLGIDLLQKQHVQQAQNEEYTEGTACDLARAGTTRVLCNADNTQHDQCDGQRVGCHAEQTHQKKDHRKQEER